MHHLCLLSDQCIPNYLPLQNEKVKATHVTLAVTAAMQKKAKAFREALERRKIPVGDDLSISDANDILKIEEEVMSWVEKHEKEDLVLNVTGGTKPMAIAAQEVFRMAGKPVFYVDIQTDRLVWVSEKMEEKRDPIQLKKNALKLKALFELNGIDFLSMGEKPTQNEKWIRFASFLASIEGQKYMDVIGEINRLASEAENHKTLHVKPLYSEGLNMTLWEDFLAELRENGLIKGGRDRMPFTFESKEAREFCQGGWLEHFVFEKLKEIYRLGSDHAWMNAEIKFSNDTKQELDVVLAWQNSLVLLECKTRNMTREGVAMDALFKVAELGRQVGGLRKKTVLVSYRPVRDEDQDRARLLGVDIVDYLPHFAEKMLTILPPCP